jgi:hypothetical protein
MIDQFQFPNMPQEEPRQFTGEAFGLSPERETQPYAYIKSIEQEIEKMRSEADESVVIRNRISHIFQPVLKRLVAPVSGESLERRLVDCESEIGGSLFPLLPGDIAQRFWYHQGDWFLEQTDQIGPKVGRYHIEPSEIAKLVNGNFARLQQEEKEHLLASIPLYRDKITELYNKPELRRKSDYRLAS